MYFTRIPCTRISSKLSCLALPALCLFLSDTDPAGAADLRVLKSGLGDGTVTSSPAGISCGADCSEASPDTANVTLTATPTAGSSFAGWDLDADADASTTPDCAGSSPSCTLPMSAARKVRPVFSPSTAAASLTGFAPGDIQAYLTANPSVTTAGEFVAALPAEFKQNWMMMARSESLQTGTAEFPRILLPSEGAQFTFTIGVAQHSSYPGAHP